MNSIRTEAQDLLESTNEFVGLSEDNFAEDLGLHVFDPAEVERNVEVQIEKQLGLDPQDVLEKVQRESSTTRRLKAEDRTEESIRAALRVAKQEISRVRRDDNKRKDELLIKIKFLQDLLPSPPAPILPPPVLETTKHDEVSEVKPPHRTTTTTTTNGSSSSRFDKKPAGRSSKAVSSSSSTTTTTAQIQQQVVMRCPSCNVYESTSVRQLNVHLNACLGRNGQSATATITTRKRVKRRRDSEEDDSSEAEDDILDGEGGKYKEEDDDDDDLTAHGKQASNAAVEDDWDPKYCKNRIKLFEKANQSWTSTWNACTESTMSEEDSHIKAEESFAAVIQQGLEKEDFAKSSPSSSDSDSDSDSNSNSDGDSIGSLDPATDPAEAVLPEPRHEIIPNTLFCPQRLWNRLLPHQRETLPFLYQHHMHETGAILGDEMGLGKTAQAVSFLATLKASNMIYGPSLVIAPATTLSQWVSEFNDWYSPFRVFVLHESFRGKKERTTSTGRALKRRRQKEQVLSPRTGPEVVSRAFDENEADIIITTYKGLQIHASSLLPRKWDYVVLDEAHIIRNPDIQVTLTCKQIQTPHRLALTGAPIQNRLRELWSLFDFIAPKRLGTLPTFEQLFAEPIRIGGMMGSSTVQIFQAFEAAKSLRATIIPYILQRQKKDLLASHALPEKTERVLFCKLTAFQREQYQKYLKTDQVNELFLSKRSSSSSSSSSQVNTGKVWRAISTLRKICNHPDLLELGEDQEDQDTEDEEEFEDVRRFTFDRTRSAKMLVLDKVLQEWRKQGHKVLVFCQGTQMLSVLERFARDVCGYPTMRMDGSTEIKKRQLLITRFNHGDISNTFLFLLTTRVGGVGVNLTGATRVVIFDPDWNPSTDAQARERAWRLGQTKPVTVYRLIVSGTIEEKIYHRQIFKQFLTNKVLHDPSQRRFFKESDLRDLFTLHDEDDKSTAAHAAGRLTGVKTTDTSQMFAGQDSDDDGDDGKSVVVVDMDDEKKTKKKKKQKADDDNEEEEEETDNVLLKSLFRADDVFKEAFNHDLVETAARSQTEKLIAEKRAKHLAREARKQFMEEQKRLEHVPVNVPTFTGASGPPPSAAALLAAAQGANWGLDGSGGTTTTTSSYAASNGARQGESIYVRLLRDIRNMLLKASKSGCTSAELMGLGKSELKNQIAGPELFRQLLREIAEFDDQKKRWFLKKKFRQ